MPIAQAQQPPTQQEIAQQSTQAALENAQANAHQNPYTAGVDAKLQQLTSAQMQAPQAPAMSQGTANMLAQGTGSPFDIVNRQIIGHQQQQSDQEQQAIQAEQFNHQRGLEALQIQKQQQLESGVKGNLLSMWHNGGADVKARIEQSGLIDHNGAIIDTAYTHQAGSGLLNYLNQESNSRSNQDYNLRNQNKASDHAMDNRLKSAMAVDKYNKSSAKEAMVSSVNESFNAYSVDGVSKLFGAPPRNLSLQQKKNFNERHKAMFNIMSTGQPVQLKNGTVVAMDIQSGNMLEVGSDNPAYTSAITIADARRSVLNNISNFSDQSSSIDSTYSLKALKTKGGVDSFNNAGLEVLSQSEWGIDGLKTDDPRATSLLNIVRQQALQGKVHGSFSDVILSAKNKYYPTFSGADGNFHTAPDSLSGFFSVDGNDYNINSSKGMDILTKHYQRNVFSAGGGKSYGKARADINAIRNLPRNERAVALNKITIIDTSFGWNKAIALAKSSEGFARWLKNVSIESLMSVPVTAAKGYNEAASQQGLNALSGAGMMASDAYNAFGNWTNNLAAHPK